MANLTRAFNLFDLHEEHQERKERKLLEFEVHDYSAYAHMKPESYYSPYSGKIINTKYVTGAKTENLVPTSFTFNTINMDSYNFKPGDKSINNLLHSFYNDYYTYVQKNLKDIKVPQNFNEILLNYKKHTLMTPYNISETEKSIKLFFSIPYRSKVFSNYLPSQDKTEFMIEERKDINKKDYAYTVLFFPSYDKNGNKSYGYLIGTLLVAYMLKNLPQNYDLTQNGKTGTKANIVCMITPDVDQSIIKLLKLFYDDVVIVPYISWSKANLNDNFTSDSKKFIHINDVSKGNISPTHAYAKVFSKLNIFNKSLLPYKKVILIDADLFPLGYYDSLFTLETPAGCIEHRRLQIDDLGINSWSFDRGQVVQHGKLIPKNLTDIENIYASDINASLLIVEPNNDTFNSMIKELQTPLSQWFDEGKEHSGFWLGNDFYNFYFLPEQNYLTKRFSGQWKSVDMGFSSWLMDIDNSFGFTFAGFIVKPWGMQSAFHQYSINPYSTFSKINNKITQKSYGYQLMNHYIYEMFTQIKTDDFWSFPILSNIMDLSVINKPFDPWEPEYVLESNDNKKIQDIELDDIKFLSYDQKKLVYLLNNSMVPSDRNIIKKVLYFDYILDNLGSKINNLEFTALSYHLTNILYDVSGKEKTKIFPFNNTMLSIGKYNSLDIINDDTDFIIVVDKYNYKLKIINIIKRLLQMNLQVYVASKSTSQFMQVLQDDNQPLYFFKDNTNRMKFSDFVVKYNFDDFKYFNVSYYSPIIEKIIYDHNIDLTTDMYSLFKRYQTIKVPWVDVFLLFKGENKDLLYEMDNKNVISFPRNVFYKKILWDEYSDKLNLSIINKTMDIQIKDKYVQQFYGNTKRLDSYSILDNIGKPIFTIDTTKPLNNTMISLLFDFVNKNITDKYNAIDIQSYLFQSS